MPIIANSKREIILAALTASGMTDAEAVAFLTPTPKQSRALEDLTGAQLVPIAIAKAKEVCSALAGMTPEQVLSKAGLKSAGRCKTVEDTGTVIGTLEAELASGSLPSVRVGKKGGKTPTSAIVGLMWLKAACAMQDA